MGNSLKTSLFSQKSDYLRKNFRYTRNIFFLNNLKRSKSREKLGFVFNTLFVQSSKIGQLKTKKLFLLKMSPIELNYAFLLFFGLFGEIHRKCLFLVQKVTISEISSEILRRFVFLNKFEKGQIRKKIRICCKQTFLLKAVKLDKYERKLFFSSKWDTYY